MAGLVVPAAAQAVVPGVNGRIAYSSAGDIYTVDPDGSDVVNVTNGAEPDARMPSWSPDATKIAFASNGGSPGWSDIFVIGADGSGLTNVTNTPERFEWEPAWSPDGTKILFVTDNGNGFEIYSITPAGTDEVNVSNNNYFWDANPAWSRGCGWRRYPQRDRRR